MKQKPKKPPPRPTALARMAKPAAQAIAALDDIDRLFAKWNAGKSPKTRRARMSDLRAFGLHAFGIEVAREGARGLLTAGPLGASELAAAWDESMRATGQTPTTRSRRLSTLRTLVEAAAPFGIAWSLKHRGPRTRKKHLRRGPKIEAARAVIDRLRKEGRSRDLCIVLLCFDLSLRTEEAVSLRVENVDLPERQALIVRKGGERELKTLTGRLVDLLAEQIGNRTEGWVFPAGRGAGHRDTSWAYRLACDLGLRGLHGLRHTVATAALAAGMPSRAVQKALGHASLDTTESYLDDVRDDAGAVARWVAGEGEPGA